MDRVPGLVERLAGCMEDTQSVKSGNVTHLAIQRWEDIYIRLTELFTKL